MLDRKAEQRENSFIPVDLPVQQQEDIISKIARGVLRRPVYILAYLGIQICIPQMVSRSGEGVESKGNILY